MNRRINALIVFALLLFILAACSNGNKETESNGIPEAVTEISGEAVTGAEVEYFQKRLKSSVLTEFSKKYNINDFSDFWESEYGGENPKDVLEERALNEAIKAKKILIRCREKGIYDEISFEGLRAKAESYNADHEKSNAVGLKSIDMDSFYSYYVENGKIELERYN